MLQQLTWFLHVICALCIIILVLLQHGKGAEIGVAQSGGASQTIFGSKGSNAFLVKLTTIFALIFAITSISLSFFLSHKNRHKSVVEIITNNSNKYDNKNNDNANDSIDDLIPEIIDEPNKN